MPQAWRLTQSVWGLAMGGFLGLSGGLVLAVILTFAGARQLDAAPGVGPYNQARFAGHANDAVAGWIGQRLFTVGGGVALALLGLAVLALTIQTVLHRRGRTTGGRAAGRTRWAAVAGMVLLMGLATRVTLQMQAAWPGLYDTAATPTQLAERRASFDRLHNRSEQVVTIAWLCGLTALGVSPWCPQPTTAK